MSRVLFDNVIVIGGNYDNVPLGNAIAGYFPNMLVCCKNHSVQVHALCTEWLNKVKDNRDFFEYIMPVSTPVASYNTLWKVLMIAGKHHAIEKELQVIDILEQYI